MWSVEWRSLAVSYSLQWHVVLYVETRVSSSGETWQAKLIEYVVMSEAQGLAAVIYRGSNVRVKELNSTEVC